MSNDANRETLEEGLHDERHCRGHLGFFAVLAGTVSEKLVAGHEVRIGSCSRGLL